MEYCKCGELYFLCVLAEIATMIGVTLVEVDEDEQEMKSK